MILKCDCKWDSQHNPQGAKFQDKEYGLNMRVHTQSQKDKKLGIFFCTVCGTKHQAQVKE